jgi:hypothetical protein
MPCSIRSKQMRLLIKGAGNQGVAAHIPNAEGLPICRTRINLTGWNIAEQHTPHTVVCYHCKRAQAKAGGEQEQTV